MKGNICAPAPIKTKVEIHKCPYCEKEAEILSEFYEWYGWEFTCLGCGDEWSEEGRKARPFMRGWRKTRIDSAKKRIEGQKK